MKLTINPQDGTITVDTPDNVSAAQFVRELLSGHTPAQPPKAIEAKPVKKRRRKRQLAASRADRPLSKALDETWAYLASADRPEGIATAEIAEAFGLSMAGAGWRLNQLVKRDMAWSIKRGLYRVGSAVDAALLNGSR
jgi:hypothetical protein